MTQEKRNPVAGGGRASKAFCLATELAEDNPPLLKGQFAFDADNSATLVDRGARQ